MAYSLVEGYWALWEAYINAAPKGILLHSEAALAMTLRRGGAYRPGPEDG